MLLYLLMPRILVIPSFLDFPKQFCFDYHLNIFEYIFFLVIFCVKQTPKII